MFPDKQMGQSTLEDSFEGLSLWRLLLTHLFAINLKDLPRSLLMVGRLFVRKTVGEQNG